MNLRLVAPRTATRIIELEDPNIFYEILTKPAPLAGMEFPTDLNWELLREAGYRYVVCLTTEKPSYDPAPLSFLKNVKMKDLYNDGMPDDPEREQRILKDVVGLVTETIQSGDGVVVHCVGGTGRTGTVIACALREMGIDLQEIQTYMKQVESVRTRHGGWPESDWQSQQVETWSGF